MNKKQKKAALSEEEDSGVEVYYREGEEEAEETGMRPKVRAALNGEKRPLREGTPVSCLRAGLSSVPSSSFSVK